MNEFFDGGFMRPIVAGGPERVGFIERPVAQHALMHGAGGDKHKSSHSGPASGLDQPQRADNVVLGE
jgi:hypothetical protein